MISLCSTLRTLTEPLNSLSSQISSPQLVGGMKLFSCFLDILSVSIQKNVLKPTASSLNREQIPAIRSLSLFSLSDAVSSHDIFMHGDAGECFVLMLDAVDHCIQTLGGLSPSYRPDRSFSIAIQYVSVSVALSSDQPQESVLEGQQYFEGQLLLLLSQ